MPKPKSTFTNAYQIEIEFSADTYVEENYDYIYIYDENGGLVGEYTGDSLASNTITIYGSSVTVSLISDSSVQHYGFYAVAKPIYIKCECGAVLTDFTTVTETTCTVEGEMSATCTNCGTTTTFTVPTVAHSWIHDYYYSYCCECYSECYHDSFEWEDYYDKCTTCESIRCESCYEWGHESADCHYGGDIMCGNCGEYGHESWECPMGGDIMCGNCGEYGHESWECTMVAV